MRKNRAILGVELLEDRTLAAATASVSLVNGVLAVQADDNGDFFTVANKTVGGTSIIELYRAEYGSIADFNANQVTSISFTGGAGSDQFYNLTALPSVQKANNAAGKTTVLVGGKTSDVLDGSASKGNFYATLTASGTEIGGSGYSNLFALGGTHSIVTGSGYNAVYSIVGADTFKATAGTGYLLVSAKGTVQANGSYSVVTFFQPAFAAQTSPFLLQKDQNGNGILYLLPQDPNSVSYTVTTGSTPGQPTQLVATYADSQGRVQYFVAPKSSVQWVAFFSVTGTSYVVNNTDVNSVFYGKSGSTLIGGSGIDVLKIHSGAGVAIGRGYSNDLFAGPSSGTPGATLLATIGQTIFRAAIDKISTRDLGVKTGDVLVGVPAQVDGVFDSNAGQVAGNADYSWLFLWEKALGLL